MKVFSIFKTSKFLLPLIIITILCGIIYYIWNRSEGIDTDSNLVTTTNPFIISNAVALGTKNSAVSQYKPQIDALVVQINNSFDSKGNLKPELVPMIVTNLKQAANTINSATPKNKIDSSITPSLLQQNIKKDNIKDFLNNVIDLATLVKQGLN